MNHFPALPMEKGTHPPPSLHFLREKKGGKGPLRSTPEKEPEVDTGERGVRLLCKLCRQKITDDGARITIQNSHTHVFFNPGGYVFEIGCFSAAPGCTVMGAATLEYSWFPGFSWRVALCSGCRNHLGWRYQSESGGSVFFGLILDALVEDRASPGEV